MSILCPNLLELADRLTLVFDRAFLKIDPFPMRVLLCSFLVGLLTTICAVAAPQANRFTVLDEFCDIYYPDARYPKLITPQWIGEDGVEAGLVLAIDDMRDPKKYEEYLRPILDRLKRIDGRAPVSIMTCSVNPSDPQLQSWLKEGVSLEAHTIDHPCPILDKNDFASAKSTYDRCVDLMFSIPGNQPVGFRTPCMDGINSASPRLFAEVMMRTAPSGRFLTISSSIGMLLTPDDPENPKELVTDSEGKPRFNKYLLPGYVNYIKDYPYPWVIGNTFWEVGFCVPDDYQGSRVNGDKGPPTVADMKASIDTVVAKKGLWVMTFHPYNWIDNKQVVELIDHAVSKHGKKIKFLNLREVQERIDKNLLAGNPLRASDGRDNGVRLLDLNADGYLDVTIGNKTTQRTRVWDNTARRWNESNFPGEIASTGARFGTVQTNSSPGVLVLNEGRSGLWNFDGTRWTEVQNGTAGLELDGKPIRSVRAGRDNGVRLRDVDGDGISEVIVSNPDQNAIFSWNASAGEWRRLPFGLPRAVSIVNDRGQDNGVRFVDFNKDGAADIISSNAREYGLWLYVPGDFLGFKQGFTREIIRDRRGDKPEIPMIVRGGEYPNNSAWFTSDTMFLQNEDTGKLPDLLERVSFKDLLDGLQAQALSPADSRAALEPLPGFVVDLVAHEPQVQSPVYLDWSADGSLWVAEMRDYPKGINGKAGGAVRKLQDEDGDGYYEKSTVFLENLNYPNGLMPWRKGVLISAVPDIIYAEDTDGDGHADKTEVLFTGFVEGNQQHRANGYEWGLDGWLYGANGDSGGEIVSKKTGKKVSISGRDFRFKPDTGEFEAISGNAQFGRHRDDWGNWFGGANYTWGWHYYLEEQYLSRNPHVAVRGTYKQFAAGPEASRAYPISRVQQRFNEIDMAGRVTSGCSFTPYRDDFFGPGFESSIFTSEPVHNLVHREVLEPDGVTFQGHRASGEEKREFLASRDPWFRPTTVKTGPDGALYICDMYRLVIEHPEWIPDDVQSRMNLRAGEGMGRIYRVRPKDKSLRKIPNLEVLSNEVLVEKLDSRNGWQRDTVQRLLTERDAQEVVPALIALVRNASSPQVRLQTAATLDTLGKTEPRLLTGLLNDSHPGVRAYAIRLSERFAAGNEEEAKDLMTALLEKTNDPELRVRYQLALSLGSATGRWSEPAATRLAELAARDSAVDALVTAILSSSGQNPDLVLKHVLAKGIESERLISGLLRTAVRSGKSAALVSITDSLLATGPESIPSWKIYALASLLSTGGEFRSTLLKDVRWKPMAEKSRRTVQDTGSAEKLRATAIQLLGRAPQEQSEDLDVLVSVLSGGNPGTLQHAALARIEQINDASVPGRILAAARSAGPQMRGPMLALLLKRPSWSDELLDALEQRRLEAADLGATIQQELIAYRSPSIQERARKLLAPADHAREELVQNYLAKMRDVEGNAENGRNLFSTHCALCHKAGNFGSGSGPNLAMLYDRGPDQIVTAILDPNRAVEDRYRNYVAELKNGEEVSGLLVSETGNSVTIAAITGIEQTIPRSELRSVAAQNRSLMPEGFEQFLAPRDLADLARFIQSSAASPKHFPGNRPDLVRPDGKGVLSLTASNAEIYGDTLIYEAGHENLGYWRSESDRAIWTVEAPVSGTYEVWLEWALPGERQKNEYLFQLADQSCAGQTEETGDWDKYRQKSIGKINLASGNHRAVFRPRQTPHGFLLDFRQIRLVPTGTKQARE